jgi:hypothetical protein
MVEADLLYSCVCLARNAEVLADAEEAQIQWLRAALYWLSNPSPTSLSRRIAGIVSASPWTGASSMPRAITRVLAEGVERSWPGEAQPPGVTVVRVGSEDAVNPNVVMHGTRGVYVLELTGEASSPEDANITRLACAVAGALRSGFDRCAEHLGAVIGLPIRDGFGAPQSELEALAECVRLGVRRACLDGRHVDVKAEAESEVELMVRHNPNVRGVEGDRHLLNVHFRRYLGPRQLLGVDAEIVDAARQPIPLVRLAELAGVVASELRPQLRKLEAEGLLDVYLMEAW